MHDHASPNYRLLHAMNQSDVLALRAGMIGQRPSTCKKTLSKKFGLFYCLMFFLSFCGSHCEYQCGDQALKQNLQRRIEQQVFSSLSRIKRRHLF